MYAPLIGRGLFDRVELFPLDVLNQRQFKQLRVGDAAYNGMCSTQACAIGRAPTALSGHDLITPVRASSQQQRLHQSIGFDGLGEFFELIFVEATPRLVRIWID